TAFGRQANPGVTGDIRCLGRIALATTDRVGRKEPFHTLDISGRCAVTLVHVAAADPFRAGSHSNLITHAVVTYYSAHGVATMATVIARERRIVMAWVANAVMDGVVPVVIVICVLSVPATVVRFECIMRPANTSVGAPHNNVLSSKSQCPDLRCV